MSSEIKYVGTCPACGRGIEHGDDVVERKGVVYHEGCEPAVEPEVVKPAVEPEIVKPAVEPERTVASQLQSLAVVKSTGGKKVAKNTQEAELLEKLVSLVSTLTQKVADLESRPAQAVSFATAPKKSKAEKGAPRPDVYYIVKGYASEKRQPQFLKVSRAIAQAAPETGKMTEMEVWNALMDGPHPSEKASKSVGSWNYRQTPFYIFKYYRAQMIEAEYILGPFNL